MTSTSTESHLGKKLREHRGRIGLSLRTFAAHAGFSPGFISQVENGLVSPSIASLEQMAACLQMSLSELFHQPAQTAFPIVQAEYHPELEGGWSQSDIGSSNPGRRAQLQSLVVTVQPGSASGKTFLGEQFVFVVAGEVTLTRNGTNQILSKGDSVTVDSQSLALWVNASENPVQLLFVSPQLCGAE